MSVIYTYSTTYSLVSNIEELLRVTPASPILLLLTNSDVYLSSLNHSFRLRESLQERREQVKEELSSLSRKIAVAFSTGLITIHNTLPSQPLPEEMLLDNPELERELWGKKEEEEWLFSHQQ